MTVPRLVLVCLQLAAGVALLAGCAPATAPDTGATGRQQPQTSTSATPDPVSPLPTPSQDPEPSMDLAISVGDQRLSATLDDSAASRDLLAQLPLTVRMTDHGGVEKTGRLPAPLSLEGQPEVGDPAVGDVGYYAPGQDLVLYYGKQSAYPGIVVLGRMTGDSAVRLAALDGPVTVTVEARTD